FMVTDLPLLAIVTGGLMFGIGMVMTRGCVSRLTVLTGSGNLRAALVIIVFAIVAHATLKGVLAPLRVALGNVTINLGDTVSLAALPGGSVFWAGLIIALSLAFALKSGTRPLPLLGGALIGLLVPMAWVGTGFILLDDFDPITMESLSFTSPAAESLFFTIASSAIPAGFGTGLISGVIFGSLVTALLTGRFHWQSFENPRQTGRYMTGATLMGIGGVLAGGCTVGAGLAGIPTLSIAAILALVAIAAGGLIADAVMRVSAGSAVPASRQSLQPAE
ncbi:MAG: YeeE/YedE family protein, partial [Rhodobacteraceae bacterium]|nr:YeeE/YedE family protein [Paracoccaceae bacterium]